MPPLLHRFDKKSLFLLAIFLLLAVLAVPHPAEEMECFLKPRIADEV